MRDFSKIYLSWRKDKGSRRHLVGILEKNVNNECTFNYDKQIVQEAKREGFEPYIELPDINRQYDDHALHIFAQRLMKPERPDIQQFYDFWEIEPFFEQDYFYLLGHTQGLLPTDNFEFLADYKVHPKLHFLTELASTTYNQIPSNLLSVKDLLRVEKESENPYDNYAVKVFKEERFVGYIKKVHNRIFYTNDANHLDLTVKAIEKNGTVKKLFIKVEFKQLNK